MIERRKCSFEIGYGGSHRGAVPGGAAEAPITITFPARDDVVDQGSLTVRGSVASDGDAEAWVLFVVDVSGSTTAAGYDCNGDGSVDSGDDLNGNGSNGEILDCEIAGVIALNTQLSAIPGAAQRVKVGLVPFGSSAALADVGGKDGSQAFVSPITDDTERDRTADIVQAAASMTSGRIALFESARRRGRRRDLRRRPCEAGARREGFGHVPAGAPGRAVRTVT